MQRRSRSSARTGFTARELRQLPVARVPGGLIAYYFSTKEGLFQPLARNRADAIERTQHRVGSGPEYPLRGRSACLRRVVPQPIGSI